MFKSCLQLVIPALLYSTPTNALSAIDQALQLSSPPDLAEFYPSNQSNASSDISTDNGDHIICNGDHFGYNVDLGDCQNAESYLQPDLRQWTFSQRHAGMQESDFPLPYRLMGGKLGFGNPLVAAHCRYDLDRVILIIK